jgi:hypothetical protein
LILILAATLMVLATLATADSQGLIFSPSIKYIGRWREPIRSNPIAREIGEHDQARQRFDKIDEIAADSVYRLLPGFFWYGLAKLSAGVCD